MPAPDRFVQKILTRLLPLGPVEARRMFSGYGLYLEGTIFALVFDGGLYLKADAETKGEFEKRGCGPITYEGHKGQEIALPYWETPKAVLKDGKTLCRWAHKAYEAGLRFNARKKKPAKESRRDKATADEKAPAPSRRGVRAPRYKPDF
jgi:DNA transformation protein